MKILLCNDDGYQATGIVAFYEALKALPEVQVEVVAPEHNNSAKSNALTLRAPLSIEKDKDGNCAALMVQPQKQTLLTL